MGEAERKEKQKKKSLLFSCLIMSLIIDKMGNLIKLQ